eukprot:CAMPEP_0116908016 /NCGR_PEP_ID=MMETSP0467-20121206/13444_1 /TAXON_ID=283647 /ORGANISM="Mesodinium pulex, Strain SPMC105" /LENGTH=127 /DNA_ID=CAMNT_0004583133 /DNA_START=53 /DNA_END=436 /DNA_ORIENTATION=-
MKVTCGLPVGAVINCADNSGAKSLNIFGVFRVGARLNKLPKAGPGSKVMASVRKGKPDLRKKVVQAVIVRQRKTIRRREGYWVYFEDNAAVIVNAKGELKGSAITGPVTKECAEFWPKISSKASSIV